MLAKLPTAPLILPTSTPRARLAEALDVALHLRVPEHPPLEAERGNVGMDSVRASDTRGVLVLSGLLA